MSIGERIDRLCDVLAAHGFDVAGAPDGAAVWETLDRELAPLTLPADLRLLLQRVDVARFPVRTYPPPMPLEFSLWSWREFRDGRGFAFPAGLFPWCYESHNHLFVELDGPDVDGGAMFEWAFAGCEFALRFLSTRDWVDTVLAVLEEGAFERREHGEHVSLWVDDRRWRELAAAQLRAAEPHPAYGRQLGFGAQPEAWPARWARSARLVRVDPPPEYPPMAIAEVRDRRREQTVRALVAGRPSYLFGGAGGATRIWLQDDTGALDVECPADIRGLAAIRSHRRELFRFEIVAPRLAEPRPSIDWYALVAPSDRGLPDWSRLLAEQPPDATATIVHPPRES